MKKIVKAAGFAALCLCLICCLLPRAAHAASPTDEILTYQISAEVNEDATVNLTYHLEWKVLESDGIGPVEWVNIGIPSSNYVSMEPLSPNIASIEYSSSYGSNAEITFNKSYYEDEVISFDFLVVMDYMYQINGQQDGYTTYYFTPGWFDEIEVDQLRVCWSSDKVSFWSGSCIQADGWNVWETSLSAGEQFTVEVSYPNDTFAFNQEKSDAYAERYFEGNYNDDYSYDHNYGDYDYSDNDYSDNDSGAAALGGFFVIAMIVGFIALVKKLAKNAFESASGFGSGKSQTKITRTKIVYYDNCPNCAAPRQEGKDACQYCGTSMIKSEEVIKEENIKPEDKEALKYTKNGLHRYSSSPNTYVRVNVVHVPIVTTSRSGSSSSRSHSSSSRSSCAHSSCACACASCACACACACAGGGRAGCTVKDFYKTNLKLKQLELKQRKR